MKVNELELQTHQRNSFYTPSVKYVIPQKRFMCEKGRSQIKFPTGVVLYLLPCRAETYKFPMQVHNIRDTLVCGEIRKIEVGLQHGYTRL